MKLRQITRRQRGFSMLELMIGIGLALIATLVIFQAFGNFEGVRRTLGSGASAQENGAYGLFSAARDIRMAGSGMLNSLLMNCNTQYTYYDSGSGGAPLTSGALIPVSITSGGNGAGASDTIAINWGNAIRANVGGTLRSTMPSSSSELNVDSTVGFNVNDVVWVVQNGNCTMMQLTQVQPAALKIQHNPGSTPTYNPAANYQNTNSWPAYTTGATIYDMGRLYRRTFSIVNNAAGQVPTFQSQDFDPHAGTLTNIPVADNIVSLKAQYGIAGATGSQSVAQWVNATGATWTAPTMTNAALIKAVRIAIVARSQLIEKPGPSGCNVTAAAPTVWPDTNNPDGTPYTAPVVNLTNDANWQCYRYRTFMTVVPLRNVLWANM